MSPPALNINIAIVLLLALIMVNVIGLSVLIFSTNNNSRSTMSDDVIKKLDYANNMTWWGGGGGVVKNKKKTHIDVRFNSIMDIYRIDMSCDFIINDLAGRVSDKYKNDVIKKKCSLSSLDPQVDRNLNSSLIQSNVLYSPVLSIGPDEFDPFANTSENKLLSKRTRMGGVFTPELIKGAVCGESFIDNLVFIVPYSSSRLDNLRVFLINMHNYLQTVPAQFKYKIVVVEQKKKLGSSAFNKGRLYNAAVQYVIESGESVDCVVLHDVDLIPSESGLRLGERGDYRCRQMPWHLSRKVHLEQKQSDILYNKFLTGGILSLRLAHYTDCNGFSNEYFGWGGEDDDFQLRMFNKNLCIMRPSGGGIEVLNNQSAPFKMLKHQSSTSNTARFDVMVNALIRQPQDGLSNINRLVSVDKVNLLPSFTHLLIRV